MAKEIIKPIKSLPDYYISDTGIAYTTKISPRYNPNGEMKILRPRIHPSGYLYIGCFKGKGPSKQRIWKRVHRVVYETFVGTIHSGLEIDHINRDKHDNRVTNLRTVTHSENCKNRKRKKL